MKKKEDMRDADKRHTNKQICFVDIALGLSQAESRSLATDANAPLAPPASLTDFKNLTNESSLAASTTSFLTRSSELTISPPTPGPALLRARRRQLLRHLPMLVLQKLEYPAPRFQRQGVRRTHFRTLSHQLALPLAMAGTRYCHSQQ